MSLRQLVLPLLGLALAGLAAAQAAPLQPARSLQPYADEAALDAALARWRAEAEKLRPQRAQRMAAGAMAVPMPSAPSPAAAPATLSASDSAAESSATSSITNVQTAGVDEGGIVKQVGEHLVILRRGRLFTLRVGADQLTPAAMVDAYAPGSDPRGAWYDELLVSGSTVVVIGYSYARGGTEVGLFDLGRDGALAHRSTYHLRSFDYYSSRNYASRLVGNRLLFYTPTLLQPWGPRPAALMPGLRRFSGQNSHQGFERILPATRIFRTDDDFDPASPLALHTVTSCEISAAALQCDATAVLGPPGRVFYVSQGSVYVWTAAQRVRWGGPRPDAEAPGSAVFRLPLDGAPPSALKTVGVPIDQMSFLEDGQGNLNVLLRESGSGEGMWGARQGAGRMALLRVPLADFGDGRTAAAREQYQRLPGDPGMGAHNRYVGTWLLWGGSKGAWAVRPGEADSAVALDPGHAVERIEAMGAHAVLVGSAGQELHFSAVRLAGGRAQVAGHHVMAETRQGETRSHGFFYRPGGEGQGLLGLPVLGAAGQESAESDMAARRSAASVVFLRQRDLSFTALGSLASRGGAPADDACKASCVDWYGNARPIFLGGRVLALMGYELVEGTVASRWGRERIEERRRVSFAPRALVRDGRPTPFD
jgi:hypothetical protein